MSKNKTSFKEGNKSAEKWTIETVTPYIEKVYQILTESDEDNTNPVRANDIKYLEEAVLCAGVNICSWYYWLQLFEDGKLSKDAPVFKLIKSMKKICELRLSYSGATMDIFHLKNHYDYNDGIQRQEIKHDIHKDIDGFLIEDK